uniref:Alkylated DNA repair protein AlkB homologue 8 N-terminal domain-containing protein n=1 Tax=Cyprinus carpio TaxID=7962 RepID=A0A8C2DCQ4_CYPCA
FAVQLGVRVGSNTSSTVTLNTGAPQGCVLSPLLFTLLTHDCTPDNNLSLNVEKTKEIVVDFRRVHTQYAPLTINGATVERVSSTKFLGVHITEDLSWTDNTAALAKKAQQRLYF